ERPARARPDRAGVPGVRGHHPGGLVRRLVPPVLPDLPDRRQATGRPAAVPPAQVTRMQVLLTSSGAPACLRDRHDVARVRLFWKGPPWQPGTGRPAASGGTGPAHSPRQRRAPRRRPAAAPDHVDVAATLLQPPRCHIDVVTRAARTAPARAACTTRTTGTACPRYRCSLQKSRTHATGPVVDGARVGLNG